MIRRCNDADDIAILDIINAAAQIYKGIIPEDRWPKARWEEPYMGEAELREEIAAGVVFWAEESEGALRGVMGLQDVHSWSSQTNARPSTYRLCRHPSRHC